MALRVSTTPTPAAQARVSAAQRGPKRTAPTRPPPPRPPTSASAPAPASAPASASASAPPPPPTTTLWARRTGAPAGAMPPCSHGGSGGAPQVAVPLTTGEVPAARAADLRARWQISGVRWQISGRFKRARQQGRAQHRGEGGRGHDAHLARVGLA